MSNSISFTVFSVPKGKMRHQTVVTLRCGQCQRIVKGQRKECPHCLGRNLYFMFSNEFTPKEQVEYENFVALCAQQAMRGVQLSGPLEISCKFNFGIPKSREKKLKDGDWHTQRPDTDNCVKSIWDALNKVAFTDDCTVVRMKAEKRWTTGTPRIEVQIISLTGDH